MARDEQAREPGPERPLLDRRAYLRLTGAAAASVTVAGASGDAADAPPYDVVTVPADTEEVVRVAAGETFEGILLDVTADDARVELRTEGRDSTVRNVGVKAGGEYTDRSEVGVEDSTLPNALVVDGSDRPGTSVDYAFAVSGAVRRPAADAPKPAGDGLTDGPVVGSVSDGAVGYRFSGDAIDLSLDGPADLRIG